MLDKLYRAHPRLMRGLALAVALIAPLGPASAHAASTSLPPGCSGGNTAGATLLQTREAAAPGYSATLTADSVAFLSRIYAGTSCTSSTQTLAPLGAAPSLQLTTAAPGNPQQKSTAPIWSCPRTTSYQSSTDPNVYGCSGALVRLTTTFGTFQDTYQADGTLDTNESVDSGNKTWSNVSNNFHDNNGGSWTPSINYWKFWNGDGQGFTTWEYEITGSGYFQVIDGSFGVPYWGPLNTMLKMYGETVHIGLKGDASSDQYFGSPQPYDCWFGEFKPRADQTPNSGWCASA